MRLLPVVFAVAISIAACFPARAAVIPLYDGALGTTPDLQGWAYGTFPPSGALATQTAAGGVTTLDTTPAIAEMAGYGRVPPLIPALDRTAGYTVTFDVKIVSETHLTADRAGFSIIALSQDLQGIELGFWTNEIWAQSGPAFTHAEGQLFDTMAGIVQYALTILGGNYTLFADGAAILTGALRDYSSVGFLPYTVPSFLFLGDDTSSAAAVVDIATIGLRTGADIILPEPASLVLLTAGLAGMGVIRRRRKQPV